MKTPTFLAILATAIISLSTGTSAAPAPDSEHYRRGGGGGSCPGHMEGHVLVPTLTVPVSQVNKAKSYGASNDFVMFTPNDLATVINFEIPNAAKGKTCTLYFSFPTEDQLGHRAPYFFEGPGNFAFVDFVSSPSASVTYNTLPPVYRNLGIQSLQPGHLYNLSSIPCPVGSISGATGSTDSTLIFYEQNTLDCPMGLFTVYS